MELGRNSTEALDLWRRVTVSTVRSDAPDLTARQMAVLMTVRLQPAPHTVRGLASALNVGKPAITRALDTLSRLGFVQRRAPEPPTNASPREAAAQRAVVNRTPLRSRSPTDQQPDLLSVLEDGSASTAQNPDQNAQTDQLPTPPTTNGALEQSSPPPSRFALRPRDTDSATEA